jgi:hypothetical protein
MINTPGACTQAERQCAPKSETCAPRLDVTIHEPGEAKAYSCPFVFIRG